MKQDNEIKEAATKMNHVIEGPGAASRKRVAKEHPEQSGSQVRGSENGEDGARLPRSDL